jgi:ABC-2 type transport system permease protein
LKHNLLILWALVVKDLTLFLSDRRGALLAFTVPIVLASAFGLIFARPGSETATVRLPLIVVLEEENDALRAMADAICASEHIQAECLPQAEALKRLADRNPGVLVILHQDLARLNDWRGKASADRPTLEVKHHPLCQSEAQWAEGVVTEALLKHLAQQRFKPFLGDGQFTTPFQVKTTELLGHSEGFNAYAHSFSGMTIQYLLFWGMESGLLLLRDRRRSVWSRLRVAPMPLWALLVGKALSTGIIAFLLVLSTFGFGALVFGVSIDGSVLGFLGLAAALSLFAATTGLMVAALGGTENRARSVCILVILGVSMLGGLWLPSFVLPHWAQALSLSLPTTWAMKGFDAATWQGAGLLTLLPNIAVITGFSALFLVVSVARFLNSEARRRRGNA